MEDVWTCPCPPALRPVARSIRIVFAGSTIGVAGKALRVLEVSHPPAYYLPPDVAANAELKGRFKGGPGRLGR